MSPARRRGVDIRVVYKETSVGSRFELSEYRLIRTGVRFGGAYFIGIHALVEQFVEVEFLFAMVEPLFCVV